MNIILVLYIQVQKSGNSNSEYFLNCELRNYYIHNDVVKYMSDYY